MQINKLPPFICPSHRRIFRLIHFKWKFTTSQLLLDGHGIRESNQLSIKKYLEK